MTEITGIPGSYNIPRIQPEKVAKEQEAKQLLETKEASDYSRQNITESEPVHTTKTDIKDISLTFNKNDDFGYIGKDSSLGSLDIEKAISDMKKDKVFEEYQYFVGGKPDLDNDSSIDGNVFLK